MIDARDLLENPRHILSLLCEAVDVEFTEAMLEWPIGDPTNDSWSKYEWYDTARSSTGFHPYKPPTVTPFRSDFKVFLGSAMTFTMNYINIALCSPVSARLIRWQTNNKKMR